MTTLRRNALLRRLNDGEIGVIANGLNSSDLCDFVGQFGFDAALIDFEHGAVSWNNMADITRACELWDMVPIVRPNRLAVSLVTRALDQGAAGIMVPHVITRADAESAAAACRYPPVGTRGVARNRRQYGVSDYFERVNNEVVCLALIEDVAAARNIDILLGVDGIDVYYVAPSDMAASMGHLGEPEHPDVVRVIDESIAAVVAAGKVAGTLVTDSNVEDYLAKGVRCVGVSWLQWVAGGASQFLGGIRNRES